jgi:cyclic lactone autoinducer peptide
VIAKIIRMFIVFSATAFTFIAAANVNAASICLYYEPEIPKELLKL